MASSLPLIDRTEPQKLKVKNKTRTVYVTHSEHSRHREEKDVNYMPVVTETSSKVLEAGVNTLRKTLVLKKQAELDEVDKELALRRQEFQSRMEALAQKRAELELKHQQNKERATKFEKFVHENEQKRRQVLTKFEAARQQNILKQREIEDLTNELKQLQTREQDLKHKISKYKVYEDYLKKTLHYLPSCYLDNGSESLGMSIIRHHESLSITKQQLQGKEHLDVEVEQAQQQLPSMRQEHSVKLLVANKELSDLQRELEALKEKNKQEEARLLMEQNISRKKMEVFGKLRKAIENLARQCYLQAYGPLRNMDLLTMMDMVEEYILDKADTERRARRLIQSSAVTNK